MGGGSKLRRPYPIKSALRGKATTRAPYPFVENSDTRGDGMLIVSYHDTGNLSVWWRLDHTTVIA